jgi:hypothetical protein
MFKTRRCLRTIYELLKMNSLWLCIRSWSCWWMTIWLKIDGLWMVQPYIFEPNSLDSLTICCCYMVFQSSRHQGKFKRFCNGRGRVFIRSATRLPSPACNLYNRRLHQQRLHSPMISAFCWKKRIFDDYLNGTCIGTIKNHKSFCMIRRA